MARYSVVHNGVIWSPDAPLSVSGGAPESWTWDAPTGGLFTGDYNYGSFFYGSLTGRGEPSFNVFTQWSQSDPGIGGNVTMHTNVITVRKPAPGLFP